MGKLGELCALVGFPNKMGSLSVTCVGSGGGGGGGGGERSSDFLLQEARNSKKAITRRYARRVGIGRKIQGISDPAIAVNLNPKTYRFAFPEC